jgi:response regulator RpfG family c-di-GMP phosphodiesterase
VPVPKITQRTGDELSLTFTPLDGSQEIGELISAIQRLSLVRSLPQIEEIVCSAARRLTGADGAAFVLEAHGECLYAEEDSVAPLWKGQRFPISACDAGWAMLNHEAAVIPDVYADRRVTQDAYRPTYVRSLAVVPIRKRDPLGAIGSYWAEPHEATAREVQLLQALADSTAVSLQNLHAYSELEEARDDTLNRFALAAEYRDDTTFEHTTRVAHLSAVIARRLGLDHEFVSLLGQAAPLHDVGKVAVSDSVLLKTDVLTSDEIIQMRAHAVCGAELLAGSHSDVLKLAQEIALTHHEWWNGTGYPNGLKGDEIPISGRIVALADVFDALVHSRPYKRPWSLDEALHEIDYLSGRQFDPMVVSAFLALDEADLALDPAARLEAAPAAAGVSEADSLASASSA